MSVLVKQPNMLDYFLSSHISNHLSYHSLSPHSLVEPLTLAATNSKHCHRPQKTGGVSGENIFRGFGLGKVRRNICIFALHWGTSRANLGEAIYRVGEEVAFGETWGTI